jgi:hypothetical protein
MPDVIVRAKSHRAREKMELAIGPQQSYYTWKDAPGIYVLTEEQAALALAIKGISRARLKGELHKCVNL